MIIYLYEKNTEGFCIIQFDDNVLSRPVTNLIRIDQIKRRQVRTFYIDKFSDVSKYEDYFTSI